VCGKVCTLTPVKEFCRFAKNVSYWEMQFNSVL
jgi:hypothetical protein